jgi:metal-responsive CopG/Arc/MetJ family transcriptional regulator
MTNAKKIKVSITLSDEILRTIDHIVSKEEGATRSQVIDAWLSIAAKLYAQKRLDAETAAYYQKYNTRSREEDRAWARLGEEHWSAGDDEEW